jgi:hypothetical protein
MSEHYMTFYPHRFAFQADSLSDFHANTHIPVVVGGQMRYEVTGDPLYKVIQCTAQRFRLGREVIREKIISSHMVIPISERVTECDFPFCQ